MNARYSMRQAQRGFTLIEVAISMVILGLVMTGLVVSLTQQLQQRRLLDTRTTLAQANDALLAFVTANGRLPCPANNASNGVEAVGLPGVCTVAAGYLPAVTLGLPNLDANGLLNDGWADGSTKDASGALNYPRAIRYSVARLLVTAEANALTTQSLGGYPPHTRSTVGTALATVLPAIANRGLWVCRSAVGMVAAVNVANRCGGAANSLALNAVAVIWSQGPTGNDTSDPTVNAPDEIQNAGQLTGAGVPLAFVMRDPSDVGAARGRFDDIVSWISWGAVADKLMVAWQVP
jgi:prepilin-type N-terminal cleavage/methylation domain-containing protein